ncbi:MAG: Fe-S cluster assembly ATPase SufC [Hyphomonadaceae bacterium]|nr:Fe-S cluster assembly ATPase SufC [Hyphomonadaceae bacterium]
MAVLEVRDLRVSVGGAEIIKGLTLAVPSGETHAIMGPNGSGKSTFAYALAGRDGYDASGEARLNGEDILDLTPEARAAKGLFLSFQYPVEIPGLSAIAFLKAALNAQRKARGEAPMPAPALLKLLREKAATLNISDEMLKRPLNVGFSGGEKKRFEALQMAVLAPRFAILDETDSGLDIDALKVVAASVNAMRDSEHGLLVITHYQRLLDYIKPDKIHVLVKGRIVKSGGPELALELEREGYDKYLKAAA